jgi:hypothetical protein
MSCSSRTTRLGPASISVGRTVPKGREPWRGRSTRAGPTERVGEFTAPWPAFVVCAAKSALQAYETEIRDLLASVCLAAQGFQNRSDAARLIARRYGLKQRDAEEWLRLTRWSQRVGIDGLMLERVAAMLRQLGLLKESR